MNKKMVLLAVLVAWVIAASGCGSGGTQSPTVLSGVASKGIMKHGVVRIFEVNQDGGKGKLVKETTTDDDGRYQAELGNHSGPVLVEVSGNYADETTGAIMIIPATAPLRAAVGNAVGAVTVSVTPLTELAVRQVEDPVSKKIAIDAIDMANARVGKVFGIPVVTTMPVDVTKAVPAEVTREQKEYSLALAALSGMMKATGTDVDGIISDLNSSMTGETLSASFASSFQDALKTFASSDRNWTDIRDVTSTRLINVGGSVVKLHLNLVGMSSTVARGMDVKVTLPEGVTVKVQQGKVEGAAASASIAGALFSAHFEPAAGTKPGIVRLAVITADKLTAGEVATLSCDVPPGKTVGAGDFLIAYEVINDTGIVPGLTVVASVGD